MRRGIRGIRHWCRGGRSSEDRFGRAWLVRTGGFLDGGQGGVGHGKKRAAVGRPGLTLGIVVSGSGRVRRVEAGRGRIGKPGCGPAGLGRPRRRTGCRATARPGGGSLERGGLALGWSRVAGGPTSRARSGRRLGPILGTVNLEGRSVALRGRLGDRLPSGLRACRALFSFFRRHGRNRQDRLLLELLLPIGGLRTLQVPARRELSPLGRVIAVVARAVELVNRLLGRTRHPLPANRLQGKQPALLSPGHSGQARQDRQDGQSLSGSSPP